MVDKVEKWYQREGWKFDMHWDLKGAVRAALDDPECNEALRELPPSDGSCDHCGAVPSINVPTSLCDECRNGVKRAETAEAQLAAVLRDKERLEWLMACTSHWKMPMSRSEIDAAMSSSQPPAPKEQS